MIEFVGSFAFIISAIFILAMFFALKGFKGKEDE